MPLKVQEPESRVKVRETPPLTRSGGETRPYDYPHLYQIQAGDWRISYAVEQNHLAILVLEVLNPDGSVRKDPERETLTRKMKVKLLDWPEGSPSRDLPPEDLGKKVKIKLLDLADALHDDEGSGSARGGKVRFVDGGAAPARQGRVSLDAGTTGKAKGLTAGAKSTDREDPQGRKVTPLDSPTM